MSEEKRAGPWGPRDGIKAPLRPPELPTRLRVGRKWIRPAVWAGAGGLCAAGLFALFQLFPSRAQAGEDWLDLGWKLGFLLLVASSLAARRLPWRRTALYVAIWAGVLSVAMLAAAYRQELAEAALRVRAAVVPSYAATAPGRLHELIVGKSAGDAYEVVADVNGKPVTFLIDTGATDIVLSPDDARRIGLNPSALEYGRIYGTANGPGRAAPVKIDTLKLGPILMHNVEVSVNQAPLASSLLGMSFVRRLESLTFKGDQAVLSWR